MFAGYSKGMPGIAASGGPAASDCLQAHPSALSASTVRQEEEGGEGEAPPVA